MRVRKGHFPVVKELYVRAIELAIEREIDRWKERDEGWREREGRVKKEGNVLRTHSTHFVCSYVASDIW